MANKAEQAIASSSRVLALEIRLSLFGFAIVEGKTVLDWGVRRASGHLSPTFARKKLVPLLDAYQPAIILIRPPKMGTAASAAAYIQAVRSESLRRSVEVQIIRRSAVEQFFAERGCTNKHAIAKLVFEWFDDIPFAPPPQRRPWDREAYTTPVFDALAIITAMVAT